MKIMEGASNVGTKLAEGGIDRAMRLAEGAMHLVTILPELVLM